MNNKDPLIDTVTSVLSEGRVIRTKPLHTFEFITDKGEKRIVHYPKKMTDAAVIQHMSKWHKIKTLKYLGSVELDAE